MLANYSSGNYGWYDKNNLPGYSKSTGTTKESTTSDKNSQETSKVTSVASSTNSNVHKPQEQPLINPVQILLNNRIKTITASFNCDAVILKGKKL